MAALLIPALMGLPGLISGIMDAVHSGKKLSGGRIAFAHRLARHPLYGPKIRPALKMYHSTIPRVKRVKRRRGRGVAADIASAIPLIGPLIGPLVRAMG